MKEFHPNEVLTLHCLKVQIKGICEAEDLKRITDLFKELSK
jgi:hypothetical protein